MSEKEGDEHNDSGLGSRTDLDKKKPLNRFRDAIGLPEVIDPFSKDNLPKKDQPSTIFRFIRLLSLWILAFSLIASFIYSILLAAEPFMDPINGSIKELVSYILAFANLTGFLMLGIASEGKDRRAEVERIIQEKKNKMREFGLTEEQVKLVGNEFMPVKRKSMKFKKFFFSMAIGGLGTYGFLYFLFNVRYHIFAMYGLVGAIISVGFILSSFAGELNVELWRFEIFGLHVHESAIGIFFMMVAIPLMYNGSTVDKLLAAFYFFIGAFLIGRDWRDVAAGKIIERYKKLNGGA
ncbi:MAG: hypothetical protein ACTSVI_14285 [Promethearchaeota archaeon]